jgi:ribose transport system permease protein
MPEMESSSEKLLEQQTRELSAGDEAPAATWRAGRNGNGWISRLAIVGVMIALVAIFSGLEPSTFPSYETFTSLVIANAPILLLALAVTITLRVGDFDLSVSSVMLVSAVVAAKSVNAGLGLGVALCLALAIALAAGIVNAFFVVVCRLDSFIATLGTMTCFIGVAYALTGSNVITGYGGAILTIARAQVGGLQSQVFVGWAITLLLLYVFDWTLLGRQWLFIGGNKEAADLLGLPVARLRIAAFCTTAVLSGVAGVLLAGSIGSVDPSSSGEYLLSPFAAAFLGTAAISIGRFNILGTLLGVLTLGLGETGLALLGAPPWITNVFNGGTLIVALGFAAILQREPAGAVEYLLKRLSQLRRLGRPA